jgi:thioredoxin 1
MVELVVKDIPITRMDCPTCVVTLEKAVKGVNGVEDARGNYLMKTLRVTYDPSVARLEEIEKAIERVGYQIGYKRYPSPISRLIGLFGRGESKAVETIGDADFHGKVLQAKRPVAVLFSSQTCPICQNLKPKFRELAERKAGAVDFYEMDVAGTETWRDYDVMGLPTIIVFRGGKATERFMAALDVEELEGALEGRG